MRVKVCVMEGGKIRIRRQVRRRADTTLSGWADWTEGESNICGGIEEKEI